MTRYESLAQMEVVEAKLFADEEFHAWFAASEGLLDWQDARTNLYEVYA